jgi:plastocyanin
VRALALGAALAIVTSCGGAATAEGTPWPTQTYGEIRVTRVRPSTGPRAVPTLPVGTAIRLIGSTFDPQALEVPLGSNVSWTNRDAIAHTTTSGVPGAPDGTWDSQLVSDGVFSFRFTQPGTYAYYCRLHSAMHATIVVR